MTTVTAPALQLGDIVVNTRPEDVEIYRRQGWPPQRGVVIWARGKGYPVPAPMFTNYQIRTGSGQTTHIDQPVFWQLVPEADWTVEDRVRRAILLWEPLEFPDEGPPSDGDTFEWQMLVEMLPAAARREIMQGDWPSTEEMLILVARRIDELRRRVRTPDL